MIEEHKTEVISWILAASLLPELVEILLDSLLHSCPVLSDIREHEGLNVSTLHSHLALTLH